MKEYGNRTLRVGASLFIATVILMPHLICLDSGRSMVCQYYFVKSPDIQETHKIYKEISSQNSVST